MNNQKRSIYSLCLYAQDRLKTCVDQALLILVHSAIDAAEAGSLHNGHECHYYILFFIILTGFFFSWGRMIVEQAQLIEINTHMRDCR